MADSITVQEFGSLQCRIVDRLEGRRPRLVVIFCHGFGAPGTDLVDLAQPFLDAAPEIANGVRFVFPAAPIDLASMGMPGGRAWWEINMEQIATMHQTRDFNKLTELEPPGLQSASSQLATAVQEILDDAGLKENELFLGGFSQGAMVSTDIVLRTKLSPAALVLMSGTMICRKEWTQLAADHPGVPVVQTHGTMDMVLPIGPAESLRDMLNSNGFSVEYASFAGPHTVPPDALQMTAQHLMRRLTESDS